MVTVIVCAAIGAAIGWLLAAVTPAPEGQKEYAGSAVAVGMIGVMVGLVIQGVVSVVA